jgi:integrase
MAKIKVRHFVEKPGRSGPRFFWQPSIALRAHGWLPERLPDDHMAAIARAERLNAELDGWRKGTPLPPEADGTAKPAPSAPQIRRMGSVAYLIASYLASPRFAKLAPKTKREYRYTLNTIERWAGEAPVEQITAKSVQNFYTKLFAVTPAKANATLRVIHLLFEFARLEGMIERNPAERPKMIGTKPRLRIWSPEEIAALIEAADRMGVPSIADAAMIALDTGQRQGDILRLSWLSYQNGQIILKQRKTGAQIRVPATPRLLAQLKAAHERHAALGLSGPIVLSEDTGRAYKEDHFRHLFARVRDEAAKKTPTLVGEDTAWFMDFRDTAVTRLAEAGCTIPEISTITGHEEKSAYNVLRHYLAHNSIMADSAIAKLVAYELKVTSQQEPLVNKKLDVQLS